MSSYTDQEWHILLEFVSLFSKQLPDNGAVLPFAQLKAQAYKILDGLKPTHRVIKYVERLLRLKPHCPQKWSRILVTQFKSQKKKRAALHFYKSTLLSKVLYFWLSAAKTPVLRSLQDTPPQKLISSSEMPTRNAVTNQSSNEQTLQPHELHISNKPSISTAVGPSLYNTASGSHAFHSKSALLQGEALGLTLGADSNLVKAEIQQIKKPNTIPVSPNQVHTFSPSRAFAAVRSLNSLKGGASRATHNGSFGVDYIDGYLDAVKLCNKNLQKKALTALYYHWNRQRTGSVVGQAYNAFILRSQFKHWRTRTSQRLSLQKHLLVALDFWAYNVKRRFMESWVYFINQTRQTRLRYLRPSCFNSLTLLSEACPSATIRPGLTRAAQIAHYLGAKTVRISILSKVFKVLKEDYEAMRFKRGAYALNIVTGCFYRWRKHAKREHSLRLRLHKFITTKEKYKLVGLFSELKKYAIYRILKNNKDFDQIQMVRASSKRIYLRRWNVLALEAAKQRELLSALLSKKNRELKVTFFSLLQTASVVNRQKRRLKTQALRFSVLQIKRINFARLKRSVHKSRFLSKCGSLVSRSHNRILKQKYIGEWWYAMDSKIKLEQFLNTRRAKEMLGLLRRFTLLRQKSRDLKQKGGLFGWVKRARKYLWGLREGTQKCKGCKKRLMKYFTRKMKDNKRRAFLFWKRKIRKGDSIGSKILYLAQYRAFLQKKSAFYLFYRIAQIKQGMEELRAGRVQRVKKELMGLWGGIAAQRARDREIFQKVKELGRLHRLWFYFFKIRKLAQERIERIKSFQKILRARRLIRGIQRLSIKTEEAELRRATKLKIKEYCMQQLVRRFYRAWKKHHELPQYCGWRSALRFRKRSLLKKYFGGFNKLTLYKRSKRILESLKAERVKQDIYYSWKRETEVRRMDKWKVREARRNRVKRLLEAWRGQVEHSQAVLRFSRRVAEKRKQRVLELGFKSLEKDLGVRYDCRRKLDDFLAQKQIQQKGRIMVVWLDFVMRETALQTKYAVVRETQNKREVGFWFQKWRECYAENMLIKECSFGKFVETLRRCFVEWKVIAITKRARAMMKREATGIYMTRLKRLVMNGLRDYLNRKLQSHFKTKMAEAHYITSTLKRSLDQLYEYAQHKINKGINMNEACRHFMVRLALRTMRLQEGQQHQLEEKNAALQDKTNRTTSSSQKTYESVHRRDQRNKGETLLTEGAESKRRRIVHSKCTEKRTGNVEMQCDSSKNSETRASNCRQIPNQIMAGEVQRSSEHSQTFKSAD